MHQRAAAAHETGSGRLGWRWPAGRGADYAAYLRWRRVARERGWVGRQAWPTVLALCAPSGRPLRRVGPSRLGEVHAIRAYHDVPSTRHHRIPYQVQAAIKPPDPAELGTAPRGRPGPLT